MAANERDPIEVLGLEECWELLRSSSLGRLAVCFQREPEIFPVNFIAADDRLLLRTSQGDKLVGLTINANVALETDSVSADTAWSVVVNGTARVLESRSEIQAADELPLTPLVPTLKYVWVEIAPTHVSGRRFRLGPEPSRY